MNIDNLKCFILVAENLSFARTAEALYISQPAVTKQINVLEQELGVTLFIRSTRHVELTPAGMSFYKDAKDIVSKSQMAVNRIQRQKINSDSIRIGLSNSVALFYLSPILTAFHNKYPNVRPDIQVLNYKTVLNLFLENKLDVLFYYKENMSRKTDINFKELEQDNLSCLIPDDNPLSIKEMISVEDLEKETIIACNPLNAPLATASFQQRLLKLHSPEKVIYCDNIEICHCMVSSGMGVAILPSILSLKSSGFSIIPLSDKIRLSFGVFYHKRNTNDILSKFLKMI